MSRLPVMSSADLHGTRLTGAKRESRQLAKLYDKISFRALYGRCDLSVWLKLAPTPVNFVTLNLPRLIGIQPLFYPPLLPPNV